MMPFLTLFVLAQAGAPVQEWQWMVGALVLFSGLIGFFGRWITSAFSKLIEQHATQNKDRDAQFAEQMARRDAVLNRHADVLEQHTKILCVFMLEQSHFSDVSRQMANETISRIDHRRDPTTT